MLSFSKSCVKDWVCAEAKDTRDGDNVVRFEKSGHITVELCPSLNDYDENKNVKRTKGTDCSGSAE